MKTVVSLALVTFLGGAAGALADEQLFTSTGVNSSWGDSAGNPGEGQSYSHNQTAPPGTSLSDGTSNSVAPWGSASGSVNLFYGSGGMTASAACRESAPDNALGNGNSALSAQWISQITVNSPGMEGQPVTIRLTYHASGAASGSASGETYYVGAGADYNYYVSGPIVSGVGYFSGHWGTDTYAWSGDGSPNRTFTVDAVCTIGQPCEFTHNMQWSVGASSGEPDYGDPKSGTAQASGSLSFRCGSFVVLDPTDENGIRTMDYTADSPTGSAQAVTYPAGTSFSNFSLTNAAPGRFSTSMELLGGQASADTQVVATFVAPPTDNTIKPVSDVVDLKGTNADPVVVKVNFDPSTAQSFFGSHYFDYLALAWFQTSSGTWKNAVLGNTGTTEPTLFNRGYNPDTDFHLGYFGIDTVNHYAWAVVNHNSEFVVTVPTPELAVKSVTRAAPTTIHLVCKGEPTRANRIETSTDLANWSTLATLTAGSDGTFTYDDTNATGTKKFYRVAYP